jgi:hypothetical protein
MSYTILGKALPLNSLYSTGGIPKDSGLVGRLYWSCFIYKFTWGATDQKINFINRKAISLVVYWLPVIYPVHIHLSTGIVDLFSFKNLIIRIIEAHWRIH